MMLSPASGARFVVRAEDVHNAFKRRERNTRKSIDETLRKSKLKRKNFNDRKARMVADAMRPANGSPGRPTALAPELLKRLGRYRKSLDSSLWIRPLDQCFTKRGYLAASQQTISFRVEGGRFMPMIVFTYSYGALSKEKALRVAEQIRESMIRNYVIKTIPDGVRAHTRIKIVETPPNTYILDAHDTRPLYDVELVGPIDSVAGRDADDFAREITTAILTAEGAPLDDDNAERVWCIFNDVPDMRWAIGPKVMGRRSVLKHILRHMSRTTKMTRHAAE